MEKRIPIAIVLNIAQVHDQTANGAELTYTDNVSAHGACVVSSRSWKLGELMEVTPLKEQTTLLGKVAHCEKRSDHHYGVGLVFQGGHVTWSMYRRYVGLASVHEIMLKS